MNVYDWLSNLPIHDPATECRVMEISFNQGSRKDYYRNNTTQIFEKGEMVSVEGVSGFDVGSVSLTGELVRIQMKKKNVDEFHPDMKKVLRRASDRDLDLLKQNKAREQEAVIRSRAISILPPVKPFIAGSFAHNKAGCFRLGYRCAMHAVCGLCATTGASLNDMELSRALRRWVATYRYESTFEENGHGFWKRCTALASRHSFANHPSARAVLAQLSFRAASDTRGCKNPGLDAGVLCLTRITLPPDPG